MRAKRFSIMLSILFLFSVTLCSCIKVSIKNNNENPPTSSINDKNQSESRSMQKISSDEAINIVVNKKGLRKEDLEYSGIDEGTGDYMVTLSPKQSKGATGRTFFINPLTGEIK